MKKQLLALLNTIKGSGTFVCSGVQKFTPPGLQITGVGEVGFPITPIQIRDIIKVAKKAPFGKGSQTVTDTKVRSAWEIDASALSFRGEDWENMLEDVLRQVGDGLGIEAPQTVRASLYKLLVYEQGDFFLSHKDSEKEPGMFGTLVIGLPSAHTGGELAVRFDGREEIVDFSTAAGSYKIPFAAFFADCDHELKPVTSGYRVCLVYNLLQSPGSGKIGGPKFSTQVAQMAELLKSESAVFGDKPKAVLLGHQYTAANFWLSQLKLHDRPRAESLLQAAQQAGYFACLGLVTHYLQGELDDDDAYFGYRGRRNKYRRYEEEDTDGGTMGEVYETSTDISFWSGEGMPGLGDITLDENDLITEVAIGTGDPIQQEAEGFTGNAGMTMQYWYHYGAVILWPAGKHWALLKGAPVQTRLEWLHYYCRNWDNAALNPREMSRQLIARFLEDKMEGWHLEQLDFSPIAAGLLKLNDKKFLAEEGEALLAPVFDQIQVGYWTQLIRQYPSALFDPIFELAACMQKRKVVNHLLEILVALDTASTNDFLQRQIRQIPYYLANIPLANYGNKNNEWPYSLTKEDPLPKKVREIGIIEKVLALSRHKETDTAWQQTAAAVLTRSLPREYVNDVLAVVLLNPDCPDNALAKALYAVCVQDLGARVARKPVPPADWRREVPTIQYDRETWEMLRPFLESPTQNVFEYRRREHDRRQVEYALQKVTIDLKTETLTKGSPHTLLLIKTRAAYDRAVRRWEEDVVLLEKLNYSVANGGTV